MVIIGILAAIAIPQFSIYRTRSYDALAEGDLRNIMTAEEAYWVDNEQFSGTLVDLPGAKLSRGVTLGFVYTDDSAYHAYTYHSIGSKQFCFETIVSTIVALDGISTSCP